MGVTASTWLYLYQLTSIVFIFLATALYFGALAAYGHFTSRSLAGYKSILLSGLIFLILFGVLSLFIPGMTAFDSMISLFGVASSWVIPPMIPSVSGSFTITIPAIPI